MQSVSSCWDDFPTNKQSLCPVAAAVDIARDELRKRQFVFTICLFVFMCNLAKPRENTACFDCTRAAAVSHSACLSVFPVAPFLCCLLRMERLQSVLKILLVYLEGTRKLSAEICGPSCSAVVQLRRGTPKDAFKQLRPV